MLALARRLTMLVAACAALAAPAQRAGAQSGRGVAVVGREHRVPRGGLRIALWEKQAPAFAGSYARTGKVVLLVHGATWSGRPDFDLPVRDYSLMDYLARNGYDAWAIDLHGYGRSDTTSTDWSTAEDVLPDIDAAVDYILKLRRVDAVHLLGWSWGTQTAGLYTMRHPEKVAKLVLYAPTWKGTPDRRKQPRPTMQYRVNTDSAAREDFIKGQYEPDVLEKFVSEALRADRRSPNGTKLDYLRLPLLDPQRIVVPTMVIFGVRDPGSTDADLLPFFRALAAGERSYVVLPDDGHAVMLGTQHRKFQQAVLSFLDRP